MQTLDYTFEIFILLGIAIVLFQMYVNYVKVDKNADGDKLMANYLKLEAKKCRKSQK